MSWDSGILNTNCLSLLFGTQGKTKHSGMKRENGLCPGVAPLILLWEVEVSIRLFFNLLQSFREQRWDRERFLDREVEHRLGREAQFWGAWFQRHFPGTPGHAGAPPGAAGRPLTVSALDCKNQEMLTLFSLYLVSSKRSQS